MKIYNKIVIDIGSYETLYEDSYEYFGEVTLCKGGSSGGGDSTTTVRYDPIIEGHHHGHLDYLASFLADAINNSPFVGYTPETTDVAMARFEAGIFGVGYTLYSFPSLYDMYGKFMAGLDIDALYDQIFEDTVNSSEVSDLVSVEAALYDDDIETNVLPRFLVGMRDINAVQSSSFVIGKSIIEDSRIKSVAKFSAELKYKLIPVVSERWKAHLEWNKNVVMNYAQIIKLYVTARMDLENHYNENMSRLRLWPFTVLQYESSSLGCMQVGSTTNTDVAGSSSKASGAIGSALTGAAAGAMMTPANPFVGGAIGGVLGLASSFF